MTFTREVNTPRWKRRRGDQERWAYLGEALVAPAEVRKILGICENGEDEITPEDVRRLLDVLAKTVGVEKHPALLAAMEMIVGAN